MSYGQSTSCYLFDEDLANYFLGKTPYGSENSPDVCSESTALSKGTYYIRILNKNVANSTKFKVQVSFESYKTNDIEPNDSDYNAMTLPKNTLITGAITEQDRFDWYKFTVSQNSKVTLSFTHYFNGEIYLYNSGNYTDAIYIGDGSNSGLESSPFTDTITENLSSGTYYIKITCRNRTLGKYTIKWTSTCQTHSYKTTVTPATTKANGKIVKKCSVCGETSTTTIAYPKTITLSSISYTYDGKVKKPSVIVKKSDGTVISASNYTVTYESDRKNVGKYNVIIKFKGNYSGTVTKTFTIKPKATSISNLTSGKKKFTIKWKKQSIQTTGYEIQYSTSSKFSNAKTVTVGKNSTTSKTISGLSAKKKYYVRVRTYKTVNGTKYYSSWSKAKTVTTKK